MGLIFSQNVNSQSTGGGGDALQYIYIGTGAEGQSFTIPALAGKVISTVYRQGSGLAVQVGVPNNSFTIGVINATATFTLQPGDVVGAGEQFTIYYYNA